MPIDQSVQVVILLMFVYLQVKVEVFDSVHIDRLKSTLDKIISLSLFIFDISFTFYY